MRYLADQVRKAGVRVVEALQGLELVPGGARATDWALPGARQPYLSTMLSETGFLRESEALQEVLTTRCSSKGAACMHMDGCGH